MPDEVTCVAEDGGGFRLQCGKHAVTFRGADSAVSAIQQLVDSVTGDLSHRAMMAFVSQARQVQEL